LLSKSIKIETYRTLILPVVLYGCEIWPLTLREECRLRLFENRVLRRIFGPNGDEVTRDWRKLQNELNDLYFSPDFFWVIKSRRIRLAGHVARIGERRGVYRDVMGKPEGKRQFGRPRRIWKGNIYLDLSEVGAWTGSGSE